MFRSLVSRITFLCSASLIVLSMLFLAANQYAIVVMRGQAIASHEASLTLYARQLDDELEATRLQLVQYIREDQTLNTLNLFQVQENRYLLGLQVCQKWLDQTTSTNRIVDSMFLYAGNSDTLLTSSRRSGSLRHRFMQENIQRILKGGRGSQTGLGGWGPIQALGYAYEREGDETLLVNAFQVSEQVAMGAVVLASDFIEPLQNAAEYTGQILFVYADDGTRLAPARMPEGFPEDLGLRAQDGEPVQIRNTITNDAYVAMGLGLGSAPVRIVTLLPEEEALRPLALFRRIANVLPVVLLLIGVLTALMIRASLHRPFQRLTHVMERVSAGDLAVRLPLQAGESDEFLWVNGQFNTMVEQIDHLNRDVREQTRRTHLAEIRHLQAQINPHFYQNTLNIIYNLAVLHQYELIQKTALHLADYFRFTLRSGNRRIELREELRHIESYMEIQKIRYPGALHYETRVEEGLLSIRIFPLLIQPFVENCVIHGFTTKRLFRICVRLFASAPGRLRIEIEDNGLGMAPERIEALNRLMELDRADDEGEHIGVWNVITRLKRYYGSEAALRFASEAGTGTRVCIELPTGCEEEGNDEPDDT